MTYRRASIFVLKVEFGNEWLESPQMETSIMGPTQLKRKMTEEITSQTPQQSSPRPSKPRINLQELRNSDLVSRYLAATPPYLYSAPVGPHNFFFSEMLRSLVQARNNSEQTVRSQANQISAAAPGRRPRKRAWSNQRPTYEIPREQNEIEKQTTEKPLELTNKATFPLTKYQKCESPKILTPENAIRSSSKIDPQDVKLVPHIDYPSNMTVNTTSNRMNGHTEPAAAAVPPSELVLPPPPPMWYPPLYPPYGIDPLHFFIDLRVSGHIYDRKKENISPTSQSVDNNNILSSAESETINKHRHGSAFSVPKPRRDKSPLALNLSSGSPKKSEFNHTYEHGGSDSAKSTNYVLQNLPRIYTHLAGHSGEERNSLNSEETDCKSDCDVQDIDGRDDRSDENFDETDDVVIVDNKSN
ncbi:hypothetical protein Bhyg_15499 [Pseudolycoriella hygida]|uniref:Uncharacterized protein n=1 Tax=Pseudolycoriella hygida TaxID=35572 RepID=A0A9Q0MN32_9DIPT|nr:hypothetical protein Bhyg_15499 [Pseudolycoriella hygida]